MLNEAEIKASMAGEKDYTAKICCAMDVRVQRWLTQCKMARDCADVNDCILELDGLVDNTLDNGFVYPLPAAFFGFTLEEIDVTEGGGEWKKRKLQNETKRQATGCKNFIWLKLRIFPQLPENPV